MWHQILVVVIKLDVCLFTEPFENVPSSVGRDRGWRDVDLDTDLNKRLVFLDLLDLRYGVATLAEGFGNSLGERRTMEGWEDRPTWDWERRERAGMPRKGRSPVQEASVVETLLFREHGYVAVLKVNVLPPKSLAALVTPVAKNFRSRTPEYDSR